MLYIGYDVMLISPTNSTVHMYVYACIYNYWLLSNMHAGEINTYISHFMYSYLDEQ